jgi:hypothetical protein
MGRIGVKYCGGCNPRIDRVRVVREMEKRLRPGCRLETEPLSDRWDTAVLVCGCEVKCANRPAVRNLARRWILVGGPTVDLESVPEDRLAGEVVRKIMELK